MNAFVERILERPTSHKVGIWVVTLGLPVFLVWQYLYSPLLDKQDELQKEIESTASQISTEERVVRNLPKFRDEVKRLEGLKKLALDQLPFKREIPNLLNSVTTLAKESGLEVLRFAPDKEIIKDFYAEIPVAVEFKGTFNQVMTFFDEVSRLSRIISVGNISLGDPRGYQEKTQVAIDGSCKVTAYRHLEESEMIKESDETPKPGQPKTRKGAAGGSDE